MQRRGETRDGSAVELLMNGEVATSTVSSSLPGLLTWEAGVRVERFDPRATESFEPLHIRIRLKFCQKSGNFVRILQKIWNCEEFSTFSKTFGFTESLMKRGKYM